MDASSAVTPSTDQRLQVAIKAVVDGMQRFEALHPQLRSLPEQVFASIATRGQQLHEEFLALQRLGVEVAGDGRTPMLESNALPYAERLETFAAAQASFVQDAEVAVRGASGIGLPSTGVGSRLPAVGVPGGTFQAGGASSVPPSGLGGGQPAGHNGGLPPAALSGRLPSAGLGRHHEAGRAGASGSGSPETPRRAAAVLPQRRDASLGAHAAGIVSPSTDQRLQTAMQSIVDGMQRFEALHPKLRSLPEQVFSTIALRGQQLHEEFLVLQRRGIELGEDARSPTLDSDAQAYAQRLESFVTAQAAFVQDAEAAVQAAQGRTASGAAGISAAGTRGLGAGLSAALPSLSLSGTPAPPSRPGLSSGLPPASLGRCQPPGHFSGSHPHAATSAGSAGHLGSAGGSARLAELRALGSARLSTAVLPELRLEQGVCADATCAA